MGRSRIDAKRDVLSFAVIQVMWWEVPWRGRGCVGGELHLEDDRRWRLWEWVVACRCCWKSSVGRRAQRFSCSLWGRNRSQRGRRSSTSSPLGGRFTSGRRSAAVSVIGLCCFVFDWWARGFCARFRKKSTILVLIHFMLLIVSSFFKKILLALNLKGTTRPNSKKIKRTFHSICTRKSAYLRGRADCFPTACCCKTS